MVTDKESRAAQRGGRELQRRVPHATKAWYDERLNRIFIRLSNKLELAIDPADQQALHNAATDGLSKIELAGSNYVVYFPDIDEALYIPALIQGLVGGKQWMEKMAAQDRKAMDSHPALEQAKAA